MPHEILEMRNCLSDEDFNTVLREIEEHKNDFIDQSIATAASFTRWYPENTTAISKIIDKLLYGERVREETKNFKDLSWSLLRNEICTNYEVQITKYIPNSPHKYDWHVDHLRTGRMMNYILYLTTPEEGGELEINLDPTSIGEPIGNGNYQIDMSIKPEKNKIAIMPAHYLHRVKPTKGSIPRLTLNGHISIIPT